MTRKGKLEIRVKRLYEAASDNDGYRVLVDRLWPRGVGRESAQLDEWARELAPSDDLRRWFNHDQRRFEEFRSRYRRELDGQAQRLEELRRRAERETVTLLYAARDEDHNNAVVLAEQLRG